jgi:hypothetical protein
MLAHSSFHAGKFVIAMLLATFGLQSPLPQNEIKPESEQVVLPMGTALKITIKEEISSKVFFQGDEVAMEVDEDVLVNGRVVIAKGKPVKGSVSYARQGEDYGRPGELMVEAESVIAVDGQEIKLRGALGKNGKDETGTGAVLSIALGRFGDMLARENKGGNARVKAGTKVKAYTRDDESIAVSTR